MKIIAWTVSVLAAATGVMGELPASGEVQSAANIRGGFCIVVGSVDGELEAELTDGGTVLVQGLALSEQAAANARKNLFSKGIYPLASVTYVESAAKLPYTDNIANVLVADLEALGSKGPSIEEINRVLGYNATAYIKQNGAWRKHYIAVPNDVNEYTHWKDDSTLSTYQRDYRAGISNQVRWIGAPDAYFKGPSNGICFFESERVAGCTWAGTVGGGTWARDAFSGVLLWREDYLDMKWEESSRQGQGQMWAANEKYFFGYKPKANTGLIAYDIRTGEVVRQYTNGVLIRPNAEEKWAGRAHSWDQKLMSIAHTILYEENVIQVFGNKVTCMDQESGNRVWQWSAGEDSATIVRNGLIQDSVLVVAVSKFRVNGYPECAFYGPPREYFADFKQITGLRVTDGEHLWTIDEMPNNDTIMFHEVIAGGNGKCMAIFEDGPFHCINAHTGEIEWTTTRKEAAGYGSYRGTSINVPDENLIIMAGHNSFTAHDAATGERVGSMNINDYFGSCPATTVTPTHVIMSEKFVPRDYFRVNKADDDYMMLTIGASACSYVPLFAYGSTYQIGGKCSCRRTIPSQNCSQRVNPVIPVTNSERLKNGGATIITEQIATQSVARNSRIGDEWTERCLGVHVKLEDNTCETPLSSGRDGIGQFMVSGEQLKHWHRMPAWTGYAKQETEPLQVGDLTLTSVVHEHRLTATRGGQTVWNFVADSRITGDPKTDGSLVYFGSHDGYVYALNANDGSIAWKFLAAPEDSRMIAYGQVESLWPVFGVVLHEGKLYATCGRLASLDGGIRAYCLNASTGGIEWQVVNVTGYSDETITHNGQKDLKTCTDGAEMSDIRGWGLDYAINDEPRIENGILKIPDWHVDISNPRDTIMFEDNLLGEVGTISRSGEKTLNNYRINPMIQIRNGVLWVLGTNNKPFRVGVNDARGRCIASYTQEGVVKTDLDLNRLANGLYIVWVQIDGAKQYAKLKLTSVK